MQHAWQLGEQCRVLCSPQQQLQGPLTLAGGCVFEGGGGACVAGAAGVNRGRVNRRGELATAAARQLKQQQGSSPGFLGCVMRQWAIHAPSLQTRGRSGPHFQQQQQQQLVVVLL
jgi:hypothetical protein